MVSVRQLAASLGVLLVGSSGCGGEDSPVGTDAGADGSGDAGAGFQCSEQRELDGGVACAVAPSEARVGTSDEFGYHAVGVPDDVAPDVPLYIYLKGTLGVPFCPETTTTCLPAQRGEYRDTTLIALREGIAHGHLVLVVAYDSRPGLRDICGDDLDCYGYLRREILEGVEGAEPVPGKDVRPPNDVFSRIDAILEHLHAMAPDRFPEAVDWATTRVGGGSQGGGHAGFIAKELRAVAGVCNLAGLGDSDSSGNPASWVVSDTWMTPRERMRAVIHRDDPWYDKSTSAWAALGLEPERDWRELSGETDNPHGYVAKDAPEAVEARAWACFD